MTEMAPYQGSRTVMEPTQAIYPLDLHWPGVLQPHNLGYFGDPAHGTEELRRDSPAVGTNAPYIRLWALPIRWLSLWIPLEGGGSVYVRTFNSLGEHPTQTADTAKQFTIAWSRAVRISSSATRIIFHAVFAPKAFAGASYRTRTSWQGKLRQAADQLKGTWWGRFQVVPVLSASLGLFWDLLWRTVEAGLGG